ncbi:hypothetical protein HBA91_00505 [Ochrobactrum sp. MR34]|nr:hypothetical protein [Ochrobactrum sp. MR34]
MSILNHASVQIPDAAVQAAMSKVLLTKAEALDALTAAIPYLFNAGTKPVDVASLAQDLLVAWDQQYSCMKRDDEIKALSDKLILAACFAGVAYNAAMSLPIMVDKAPEFLLRIFLIALVDQNSSELDPYRAKNRPPPATLTNEVTKPVDVAAVREVPVSIDKLIAELKSAEDMCFSWSGSALLANELNAADTDEGHISLYKDLCDLGNSMSYLQSEIRALSPAEPAQGEPDFSKSIAEVVKEESLGGAACGWKSCTGCLETNDGYHCGEYPYSKTFKAHVGSGCSECGGIGVVWEHYSQADLAEMQHELLPGAPISEEGK